MASELIDHSASTSEVMKFGGAPHQPPSAAPMFCADGALEAAVRRILGPGVIAQLANPALQELSANYDPAARMCRLFIDDGQGPMRPLDALIQPSAIVTVSRMLATLSGQSLPAAAPFLSCDLASGFRWHSALPPVSDGAQCSIRVHPRLLRPLSDFMDMGQAQLLESAIAERRTLLIAGGTFTGKTTLANALINLMPPSERLLVIEDSAELQIRAGNVVRRFTSHSADLKRHVKEALRDRPDRIIIGETRGPEALDLLDAAVTGHPGLSTIHADSCEEALTRIQRLAGCDPVLVREAIDIVLHIQRFPDGRRAVAEIRNLTE